MQVALIPLMTQIKKPIVNMQRFADVAQALVAQSSLDLMVLPECTFTGYLYEKEDLVRYAESIPGPTTERISHFAKQWQVSICFGLVERASEGIFNTAVIVGRDGEIQLVQRKISEKPPYINNQRMKVEQTEFGKVAVLICGDLFDDGAIQQVSLDTQLLIVPMARGFDRQSPDSRRWEDEERQEYQKAIERIGIRAVIVNALDVGIEEGSFGGGMVIDGSGKVLAESPHGTDEPLVNEL